MRRMTSLGRLAAVLLIAVGTPATAQSIMLGDVDGDQTATIADVVQYVNHFNGVTTFTTETALRADMNLDGKVDNVDLDQLIAAILGWRALPLLEFEGAADTPVGGVMPRMRFPVDNPDDFLFADPAYISLTHLGVMFRETATVAEANTILSDHDAVIDGAIPRARVALLRFPRREDLNQLIELRDELRALPAVQMVAPNLGSFQELGLNPVPVEPDGVSDGGIAPSLLPPSSAPPIWSWQVAPSGLNWALEKSRVPQAWNLLDYGRKKVDEGVQVAVGAIDAGFNTFVHEDQVSPFINDLGSSNTRPLDVATHGTGVVGMMGAKFDNNLGFQGIDPLADFGVGLASWWRTELPGNVRTASWLRTMDDVFHLLETYPDLRVINISLGILPQGSDATATNLPEVTPTTTYADWLEDVSDLWATALQMEVNAGNDDFLIFASAGNSSSYSANNSIDERYNSVTSNIAVRYPNSPVISVGATNLGGTVANYSNVTATAGGNRAAAGGDNVGVLSGPTSNALASNSGTSFASPFVAGLASYLWTLDPELTLDQMKTLLMADEYTQNVAAAGNFPAGPNLVDAFAAAMGIDQIRGDYAMQRALVDVDDGTLDGNLRERVLEIEKDPNDIHNPGHRRGDGVVNMKDFRVLRDAWLEAQGMTDYLDGPATHFKRDLNFDGWTDAGEANPPHPGDGPQPGSGRRVASELIYSRYDFNGNGLIDAGMYLATPPADALAPFKTDPDDVGGSLSQTNLRDIDVMVNPNIWTPGEENVTVNLPLPAALKPDEGEGGSWDASVMRVFTGTDFINYFWSADLHIDAEMPDLVPGKVPGPFDPFVVWNTILNFKQRTGAWKGVLTVPFHPPTSPHYNPESESVRLAFTKVSGDEYHRYSVGFDPEPGEDFEVVLGFDRFEFRSTTRGVNTTIFPPDFQRERIERNEAYMGQAYASTVIGFEENYAEVMNSLAETTLLSRSKMAGWLGEPIQTEALFRVEPNDDTSDIGVLTGAVFSYD